MFDWNEEQQQLSLAEQHISALQERISALKGRINQMKGTGQSTGAQAELLLTMLAILKSMQFVRLQLENRMNREDQRSRIRPDSNS